MAAPAPCGVRGASVQVGGAAESVTTEQNLLKVQRLLAEKKPWPAFLGEGLVSGCPENVKEAMKWMASGTSGLLNLANVGPLSPICKAFQGLIQAAEQAAEADENLRRLIAWCAFLTEVLLQHGKEVNAQAPVMTPINDFVSTTNQLAKRAKKLVARRKCEALFCSARDATQVHEFEKKLRKIWEDIRGLLIWNFRSDFRALLPPKAGDIAKVPQKAPDRPPAFVERGELIKAVTNDLVATERATDTAHVLFGLPGGGKTVVASSVVRREDVRRSFKDGVFWVQVGQVGAGNPTVLLTALADDLAHAPSNRPHTVPHEFKDAEQVISHLAGVLERANLRCLVVLDDVWDASVVQLFLRTGFHCLVCTRDLAVVPRHLRGTRTPVDTLTENEALQLLRNASGATSSIPRDEGLKVANDCGLLPLAIAIIGAMGRSRENPHSPETWLRVHRRLVDHQTLVQDHVGSALAVSFRDLNEEARMRFRTLGVLARGVRVAADMVAHLWEQAPDTTLFLNELVEKSLVKAVEEKYYLHDLVLSFAKDELRKLRKNALPVTSRQARYLGRTSVLEGYARTGEVLQGFYALMTLWNAVEELSDNQELEVSTYEASLKALEGSDQTAEVAFANWAAGRLFYLQGKYTEAERLYRRCEAIQEKVLGDEHASLAITLSNRAALLESQGKYAEAEPLYERCQKIEEKALGDEHPSFAATLSNRAGLLKIQGKYKGAKPLYDQCLAIQEKVVGHDHPNLATTLHNQAALLESQGKYAEAEPLYARCQAMQEKNLGDEHPSLAITLSNRAGLLQIQGKYTEAERLYMRCKEIQEKVLGPEHPSVAITLSNQAGLLESQGKYAEAGPLYERCYAIQEKILGLEHPAFAITLNNIASLLKSKGEYVEAGLQYERCHAIQEKVLGLEHPGLAITLNNWAELLARQGQYSKAESLYDSCQAIQEKVLDPEHPSIATTRKNRAVLLESQGKFEEAESLVRLSLDIRQKLLGVNHPAVAESLNVCAGLLTKQRKYDEAGPLCVRAIAIATKALGPDHPDVAKYLNNRAELFRVQENFAEAERLYQQSLAIREKILGSEHPDVAQTLNNRAACLTEQLLRAQVKFADEIPLFQKALSIRTKKLGATHPDTVGTQTALEAVQNKV